jgi:mono/diheme cytochrome c family protein
MPLARWIRIAVILMVILVALFAVRLHVAGGQTSTNGRAGDASTGRGLVEVWCTECHSVEPRTAGTGTIAPDFTAIARRPSTTALALKTFLHSEHKTMPHFIIEPRDADDIVAYILSLRR